MNKWYEDDVNKETVISSRVRLARNSLSHSFPDYQPDQQKIELIEEAATALSKHKSDDSLSMIRLDNIDEALKYSLTERHLISPRLMSGNSPKCVFVNKTESISVMVIEEDHFRIQAICSGNNLEKAHEMANEIDDLINESIDYAFDEKLGYLTSCPSNTGTGLRASFMLHIPYLEANGQIGNITNLIGKFGYTIRGTFGEGTEAYGSVYQISNQITLGVTESGIITGLRNLTSEIEQKENSLMEKDIKRNRLLAEDNVYRTYGILQNARQMTEKEAIKSLSVLKMGCKAGILNEKIENIYNLIINIRSGSLIDKFGIKELSEVSIKRAEYLRNNLLKKGD